MSKKTIKVLSFAVAQVMFSAALSGCTQNKDDNLISAQSSQTVSEESAAETDNPVEYPCEYVENELHCTYDGVDIFGMFYTPDNGRKKHPAVILSHGYNCIGSDMQDIAKALAGNGVSAYAFDYCGGSTRSASSGDSVDMSIETEQDNLRRVIDMVSELDSVDASQLYLYGESQGGFVAALTGAEMPDRIAGMFLVYPAFSIIDQWLAMDPSTMTEPFEFMGGMTLSKTFYDGVPRYDVYKHIEAFTNPVLIYQGDKDQIVDVSYANKINDAFPNSSLTIVKGAGHGFNGADRQLVCDEVCEFFTSRKINE